MMKILKVGGCVRDHLLSIDPKDIDYVVVGSTPEEMIAAGFEQVGADFPVFIHPETRGEYALARTETKTGSGYNGFTTNTKNVTLAQDLERRDLTINSIAMDESDNIIDPFNGRADLDNKILRATSTLSFCEDPVRVLRLARFWSRFPDFTIDPYTRQLCEDLVNSPDWHSLTSERVGNEMMKALGEKQPSNFFRFLASINGLNPWFKELQDLIDVPAGPIKWHPEKDSLEHSAQVLDQACIETQSPTVRFAALVHDLGKASTPKDKWPSHPGHERAGVPLVDNLCDRLRLPNTYRDIGRFVAEFHMHVHKIYELNPKTLVKLYEAAGGGRAMTIPKLTWLGIVSAADNRGRGKENWNNEYPNAGALGYIMNKIDEVKFLNLVDKDQIPFMKPNRIKDIIRKARVEAAGDAQKFVKESTTNS